MKNGKRIHDASLRGGFCALWMIGLVTAFANLLCFLADDSKSAQVHDALVLIGSAAVSISAALAYAHLKNKTS
jgi:hypothetical protein